MQKRTRYTLFAVFVLLAALGVALYLRSKAPPEAARLLPESDAIVYMDLRPIRAATHFDQTSVHRSPTYQQFIDSTGIIAERDLDRAAFALHRMPDPHGPNGPVAFSEVLEGRFDTQRLAGYLGSLAISQESYAGRTIFAIPTEGRTLRVAILGYDSVAASNMPTAEQIHSMLDRQRAGASPFAGSSLLEARFRDVPAFSPVWGIGHIGLPLAAEGKGNISVMGLELPVPSDATLVASLSLSGLMRIDDLTASQTDAEQTAKSLIALSSTLQAILRTQNVSSAAPADLQVRDIANSITIKRENARVTLTAKLPIDALKHLGLPQ